MPRFQIRDTFAIEDKKTFVMAGLVLEGKVEPGMSVSIPFNSSINLTAKIDRVEVAHRFDGDVVCLCIDCSMPDEVTLWEALDLKDETISITGTET